MNGFKLTVSEKASARLMKILRDTEALFVDVTSGGCNGFSYKYDIKTYDNTNGLTISTVPRIVLTKDAMDMLNGAILDYSADELGTSFFSITNPNATSKCGCGNSFSTF
jgi:iron-sulfur cluster insertion protein